MDSDKDRELIFNQMEINILENIVTIVNMVMDKFTILIKAFSKASLLQTKSKEKVN